MIDDQIKSNNIARHFDTFDEYLRNDIKAIVGGYLSSELTTNHVRNSLLRIPVDEIIDGVYFFEEFKNLKEMVFKPFEENQIILNNSESCGNLGLPTNPYFYKLVTTQDIISVTQDGLYLKDSGPYYRIHPNNHHTCLADLLKHFYEYHRLDDIGYVWTSDINLHKANFMYERLKVEFHEVCGDSYGLLKLMMKALIDIKNNQIANSENLVLIEKLYSKVKERESRLLR